MSDRFSEHRDAVAGVIGDSAIAVIPAAAETVRNDDVHHVSVRTRTFTTSPDSTSRTPSVCSFPVIPTGTFTFSCVRRIGKWKSGPDTEWGWKVRRSDS